jgi:hypothetical protein
MKAIPVALATCAAGLSDHSKVWTGGIEFSASGPKDVAVNDSATTATARGFFILPFPSSHLTGSLSTELRCLQLWRVMADAKAKPWRNGTNTNSKFGRDFSATNDDLHSINRPSRWNSWRAECASGFRLSGSSKTERNIARLIDRSPSPHDGGVTRRVPQHRPSLVSASARRAKEWLMPTISRNLQALASPPCLDLQSGRNMRGRQRPRKASLGGMTPQTPAGDPIPLQSSQRTQISAAASKEPSPSESCPMF